MRQFFPARTNGSVVLQSIEKNFDLAQRESHLAGKADEDHAVECVRGVPPLLPARWAAGSNPRLS